MCVSECVCVCVCVCVCCVFVCCVFVCVRLLPQNKEKMDAHTCSYYFGSFCFSKQHTYTHAAVENK